MSDDSFSIFFLLRIIDIISSISSSVWNSTTQSSSEHNPPHPSQPVIHRRNTHRRRPYRQLQDNLNNNHTRGSIILRARQITQ